MLIQPNIYLSSVDGIFVINNQKSFQQPNKHKVNKNSIGII